MCVVCVYICLWGCKYGIGIYGVLRVLFLDIPRPIGIIILNTTQWMVSGCYLGIDDVLLLLLLFTFETGTESIFGQGIGMRSWGDHC